MTKRPLDPDHDAVLFALECGYSTRIADFAAAADAVHRALSGDAGRVERWTLVVLVDTVLWAAVTLGALAAPAAGALYPPRTGEAPATLTGVEPADPRRPGARAGLVAAAFDVRGRSEPEARALAAGRRARLAERHRGVRPWLAAAPDITFTVRARDRHDPPSVVCAPFVVADATPERALGANTTPEPMLELARRIPFPPRTEPAPR